MPKYVYQGLNTGVTFELEQRITEAALTHHPETNEPVKRLIGRPAISFKGSGFYANDSKSSSSNEPKVVPASESKTGESKTGDAKSDTASPTANASPPAAPAKEASSPVANAAPTPAAPSKSAD